MILIVCIDERKGMMFGGKRQSRDKFVIRDIMGICADSTLYCSSYTAKLFAQHGFKTTICDNFENLSHDDYCFIENPLHIPSRQCIDKIICYRWNRHYPSDAKFPFDLTKWTLIESKEFIGNAHKEMVREIYTP